MQIKHNQFIGRIRQLGLAALLATGLASQAQTTLYDGHTDVGIDYDNDFDAWNLHVHYEVTDTEYSPPSDALLFVKNGAHGTVSSDPAYSFLGTPGSDVWTLPQFQDLNLLFLGFGAEEISSGVFQGDQFTMSLTGVSGPGSFVMYETDDFSVPTMLLSSLDGISGADSLLVPAGEHRHVNWAFSAPGDYVVTFNASGIRQSDSQFTTSGNVGYYFRVEAVPEPATAALMGVGVLGLLLRRRR